MIELRRTSPPRTQVKDILMSGVIGDVLSVDFHWMLNTHHGADYFRRWHRNKKNSGGLMVHKASHHFDVSECFGFTIHLGDDVEAERFGHDVLGG